VQTLKNGLLVDPHNDKEIAAALYRLVADKNLWDEWKKNGLKNIHLYYWPQHCKIYLSRISQCRIRHPQWQSENDFDENMDYESDTGSFKDDPDTSLRLSLYAYKPSCSNSLNNTIELDKLLQNEDNREGISDHIRMIIEKTKNS